MLLGLSQAATAATQIIILASFFASHNPGESLFASPLPKTHLRQTPLHFGVYVTPEPEQNPIDPPERFIGYHAGVDFEIFDSELKEEVPVSAICTGEIIYSDYMSGYGGLIAQQCYVSDVPLLILYGHLSQKSLPRVGSNVLLGERIGTLAPAYSSDSGHTRKHLHLGIYGGWDLKVYGYVSERRQLVEYVDPLLLLPPMAEPIEFSKKFLELTIPLCISSFVEENSCNGKAFVGSGTFLTNP